MRKRFIRNVAVAAIAVAVAGAIADARMERVAAIDAAQLVQLATLTSVY
ncbi:MAG: hypothetical protein PVI41_01585 [Roseobacter sp.]|jgi:3-deoxy-D-manno-octulosonic acid (KDO) 8-phosphate synthase